MQNLSGRRTNRGIGREVRGNVVWLTYPARGRRPRATEPVDSLRESVSLLVREIKRYQELRTDIVTAVDTRRYELYKSASGVPANAERSLVMAQSTHLIALLKVVYATAHARERKPAARVDTLAASLRELQGTLERARQLSREVLAQCQCDSR